MTQFVPLCRATSASKADQVSGLRGAMVYDDSIDMSHLSLWGPHEHMGRGFVVLR